MKWMKEIIKDYIHQTSYKIFVNKLQKVLHTSSIDKWMKNHIGISFTTLEFCLPCWNVRENLTWRLVAKKLHIVTCELQCIYDSVYNIGCSLQLLQLVC
jgi:hypothetical protein